MNKKNQKKLKIKLIFFQKDLLLKKHFLKQLDLVFQKKLHFKDIEIKNNKKGKPINNLNKSTILFKKKI